jgi:hypothetical protein
MRIKKQYTLNHMRNNYMSHLIKRSLIVSFLLFSLFLSNPVKAAEPNYIYDCVYGNNGEIIFVMLYDGRLQYQDPYTRRWINIVYLKTDGAPGSGDVVNTNSQNIHWTFCTAPQFKDWADEFYVGWKPPQKLYNLPIAIRFVAGPPSDTIAPDVKATISTVQAYKPSSPTNISASMEKYCNEVRVNWSEPDNMPEKGTYSQKYNVFRDSVKVTTTTDTFYYDTNVNPGEVHYYQIEVVLTQNALNLPLTSGCFSGITDEENWRTNIGERSFSYPGSSISTLDPPFNVNASKDLCGNKIDINWRYNGDNSKSNNKLTHFMLQRANSDSYNFVTVSNTIDKSAEKYTDTVPFNNHTYYYRMKSQNGCNSWSDNWSDTAKGINPSIPIPPQHIHIKDSANRVVLSWKDSSTTETAFVIERWIKGDAYPVSFRVAANKQTYVDNSFSICDTLYYTVLSENDCGTNSGDTVRIKVIPKISNSFKKGDLKVSKGYFSSKINISWTNESSQFIGSYRIYRKEYGTSDSTLISTVSDVFTYDDKTALSGVLYVYSVKGFTACEGDTLYTNTVQDQGFRSNYGTVTGTVTYEDGVAVNDAEVLVSQGVASGNSLLFNGTNNSVTIPNKKILNPSTAMSVEMWVKPDNLSGTKTLLCKSSGTKGFGLQTNGSSLTYWLYVNGTRYSVSNSSILQVNTYTHVMATFDGHYIRLYGNGTIADSSLVSTTPAKIDSTLTNLVIGGNSNTNSEFFAGNIDEIRLWNIAVASNKIKRDYVRTLTGKEKGLVGYWRLDLGKGLWIFDDSKNDEDAYNENTGYISGASWSSTIPVAGLLEAKGVVDEKGNYLINHIPYTGTGNVIDFTPFYGTHSFSPNQKSIFIGAGSAENTQNFVDLSSVKVTGNVAYSGSVCPANDINVFIDNQMVYKNGAPVTTNTDGQFEFNVPTGRHSVSVGKTGHGFRVGVWPTDGSLYNFTEPVSGIQFVDTTRVRVVGRVVGGNREGGKKPGLGLSLNNIGRAMLIFESQLKGGCSTDTVFTDATTGEYKIDLLPLRYIVKTVKVLNNPAIDFGVIDLLDLSIFRTPKI